MGVVAEKSSQQDSISVLLISRLFTDFLILFRDLICHKSALKIKCLLCLLGLLETSELPHLPTESSLHNESPSFSPFYEVEDSILKDSKLEESQVGVSALCNISPSYSPLSGVEESESEDSFTKEHPPCFDIGGLEDILE